MALNLQSLAEQWQGRAVQVNDVVMRDGLQIEALFVPTETKIAIINRLSRTGLRQLEVTSFVSPAAIPALRDAETVMREIQRAPGVRYAALVPNRRGAERAFESGVDEINLVVSASETHNLLNTRMARAQSLDALSAIVRDAAGRSATCLSISTAFGCPLEGEVPWDAVLAIGDRLVEAGVNAITLCDTTGMAHPLQVLRHCQGLRERWPGVAITLHFHDTRGMGLSNVLAGLAAGIDRFDASLGGLGGCPYAPGATGNICTEDLVHMLHAMGCSTGVSVPALVACAGDLAQAVGHELPGRVLKAGELTQRAPLPPALQAIAERAQRLPQDTPSSARGARSST